MTRRYIALFAVCFLATAGAAYASGGLEMATEWSWRRDGGRIFNALVVIGVILYIVVKMAGPAVSKRAADIKNEISELIEAREMAERNVVDYQKKLDEIKVEHDKAMAEARAEAEAIRSKIISQAEEAAAAALKRAGDQIDMETEQARARLRKETTLLAIAAAEELLKKNITSGDHKALLKDYISKMEIKN